MKPFDRTTHLLVFWYGLYQLGHIFVNSAYLFVSENPPFPAPRGGWPPQLIEFLNGIAAADLLNAILTLVFVYGYLRKSSWFTWVGTITLTISIYAALVFTWGSIGAGAWNGQIAGYLPIYITFIPVVVLFLLWIYWLVIGALPPKDRMVQL